MPKLLKYTSDQLKEIGLVRNPNMYLGSAFRYCPGCKEYAYVYAMSSPGKSDCFEVCRECETHYTHTPVKLNYGL